VTNKPQGSISAVSFIVGGVVKVFYNSLFSR